MFNNYFKMSQIFDFNIVLINIGMDLEGKSKDEIKKAEEDEDMSMDDGG